MKEKDVQTNLISILQSIQSDSGYDVSLIQGNTCPLNDLEGFDSMLWPAAISMLSSTIGVNIPNCSNIFLSKDGNPLTINESAAMVCEMISREENQS
jgi:hypothetical protein